MRYKEFKKAVEDWGGKYHYKPVIDEDSYNIRMKFDNTINCDIVFEIYKLDKFGIDLNWGLYRTLPDDAREDLFKIVTEFAATPIEEREDEKRFIIPLPGLITTEGRQAYLTYKDGNFLASRRDETLIQTWKEKHLKYVPEFYRHFAVEFNEGEEC